MYLETSKYSGNTDKIIKYFHNNIPQIFNENINIIIRDGEWTLGIFGYYDGETICACAPKWIPKFLRDVANIHIIRHEYYHHLGIEGCSKINCLMFESQKWYMEIIALPFQLLSNFKLCKKCKIIIEKN